MAPEQEVTAQAAYDAFWPKVIDKIRSTEVAGLKHQELPLARIKKIMKLDEEVKMISAEAPVLFAKAAEIFIMELTLRAWIHTEDNKRRTLQRNDIAMAITKYDQFDFLIDIVPRDDIKPSRAREDGTRVVQQENMSYFLQQPGQAQLQTHVAAPAGTQQATMQPQVMQLQPTQMVSSMIPPPGGIIIMPQIIGPNGETQQVPIQLTEQQLQLIRAQASGQAPLVIQTAPIATNQMGPQGQIQLNQQGQPIQLQAGQVFISQE